MIKGKFHTILLHCIGWLVFFSLPLIFTISLSTDGNAYFPTTGFLNLLSFAAYIVIFYLHTYLLFPRLYFRNKKVVYFLTLGLLLCAILLLRPYDRLAIQHRSGLDETAGQIQSPPIRDIGPPPGRMEHPPAQNNIDRPPPRLGPPAGNRTRPAHIDIISISLFILVIALSIALILEKRWKIAVQATSRAEADKANAELSFLKAQINPHFLFNTLNNIYSLAVTKHENVADAIMKLSNIMRYVTDDANEYFVALDKELDSISDYISLQQLRLGKKAVIEYVTEGDKEGKTIAPLILMPFVENAFNHGISNASPSPVIIKINIAEKCIVLYTQNKLFDTPRQTDRTGIGISNTRKRLEQVYPNKYLLDINRENGLFIILLTIYI